MAAQTAIQREWLDATVSAAQSLAGELSDADPADVEAFATGFARRLTQAPDPVHNLVLSGILSNIAMWISEYEHRFIARNGSSACRCEALAPVTIVGPWTQRDARESFCSWVCAFFRTFNEAHPPTAVARAASLIRRAPERAWTLDALAGLTTTPPRTLSRDFKARFGLGVSAYVHLARLSALLPRIDANHTKLAAVVADAGYGSRKDLYRAMQQLLHVTPRVYRHMPIGERQRLCHAIRRRLFARETPVASLR